QNHNNTNFPTRHGQTATIRVSHDLGLDPTPAKITPTRRQRLHQIRTSPLQPLYLAAIAAEINDRPRKLHDWRKPSEVFTELLESDASTT
ncbi:MAG: hypothetical protein ACJ73U_38125, partial [Actinophytocola sp.]